MAPASAIEVGEDHWIVPLDPVKSWASGDANKNYGKPLPAKNGLSVLTLLVVRPVKMLNFGQFN